MKYFNLCLSVLILCLASCSSDDVSYSCNPTIDQWAKDNIEEIRTMSRSELLAMDNPAYQRAAFAAFTPEQKLNFWLLRMDEVLTLPWSQAEVAHIEEVKALLKRNTAVFQYDYSDEEKKAFDVDLYQWAEKAETELGWSKELLSNLIATPYPMVDTKGTLILPKQRQANATRSEELPDCECHVGNVLFIMCLPSRYCGDVPCKSKSHGCGAIWVESCNGMCD